LHQGDFAAETVYDDDPVGVARAFAAAGAEWIHVVDLDAARTGEPANLAVIEAIASSVPCRVQVGGGVRSAAAARTLLLAGAARVVVGTVAVEEPALVDEMCRAHPGCIVVGLDARGRSVAVRGWTEGGGGDLLEWARRFDASGVAALVVTEIGRWTNSARCWRPPGRR
jgi:phosphoribosylformimino-5-aminoimidazole carboxamide ribotide isomerase